MSTVRGQPHQPPAPSAYYAILNLYYRGALRIERIEIDDDNVEHVTSHGVTITEIETVFTSGPSIRRNKGERAADYYAIANGIRVNFRYRPGVARPISAWRL